MTTKFYDDDALLRFLVTAVGDGEAEQQRAISFFLKARNSYPRLKTTREVAAALWLLLRHGFHVGGPNGARFDNDDIILESEAWLAVLPRDAIVVYDSGRETWTTMVGGVRAEAKTVMRLIERCVGPWERYQALRLALETFYRVTEEGMPPSQLVPPACFQALEPHQVMPEPAKA